MQRPKFLPAANALRSAFRSRYCITFEDKRVLLHIGAHKTATSLIQNYTRRRKIQIAFARLNAMDRRELSQLMGWGNRVSENPEPLRLRVQEELSRSWAKYLLLSNENCLGRPFMAGKLGLYPAAQRGLGGLAEALRGWPVTVILSIRPQADFVESYYLQLVSEGRTHSFEQWISRINLNELNWLPVAEKAANTFGAENLRVIDFRRIKYGQTHYLDHFFQTAAPGIRLKPSYGRICNPGLSQAGLEIARTANHHLSNATQRKAFRKFIHEHFPKTTHARAVCLTQEQRRALTEGFEEDYTTTLSMCHSGK